MGAEGVFDRAKVVFVHVQQWLWRDKAELMLAHSPAVQGVPGRLSQGVNCHPHRTSTGLGAAAIVHTPNDVWKEKKQERFVLLLGKLCQTQADVGASLCPAESSQSLSPVPPHSTQSRWFMSRNGEITRARAKETP